MAIKIDFDSSYNVMPPTLILTTRNGDKLGGLNYHNLIMKDSTINCSELSFKVNKNDCTQNQGKAETSHVKPLLISNAIQTIDGYTYFGKLSTNDFNQLVGYFKSNKTSNRFLTFTVSGTTSKYEVNLSQINDYKTLFVKTQTDNTEIIKVESNGNIYINNTSKLNLPINTICQVQLEFDIIIDLYNDSLWKTITDFKLVWVKEWDKFFEIYVSVDEDEQTIKNITAKSLGKSELSQINLYNIEINTENDIARDDYEPTVLYNPNNHNASLLHRITEKAPHYNIVWVDSTIKNIQRTFTFDGKSIDDAFQEIAEEIECIFEINCRSLAGGGIARDIYVYDINSYGSDTDILLSADTLADSINYSIDNGSVKNCFRLEAGDDLMTATIRNCNPNGSGYIWYISDNLKDDMSEKLVEKLELYNRFYDYYQNSYNPFAVDTSGLNDSDTLKVQSAIVNNNALIDSYNSLVKKYSKYTSDYKTITSPIVGYPAIMETYYSTIDFYYYLNDSLMPTVIMSETNAQKEGDKLNYQSLKNTAVQNLSSFTSVATVSSAVLTMAKVLVSPNYQVKILDEETSFTYSEEQSKWKGKFVITNYSDETDTYTTMQQTVIISSDYATFIKQKVDIVLSNARTDTISDIDELFKLGDSDFKKELKKYSLQRLKAFQDACQDCLDILQQQGIADDRNEDNDEPTSMYTTIYLPYYNKLGYIQAEMDIRQSELDIIQGKFDENGGILKQGMQTILQNEQSTIQDNLNFQEYLGEDLWLEFAAYRREDTYSNDNYISDGLDNAELFDRAMEFIQTAKDEIEKSATLQHTITATLKNLLVMKEFRSIVDYFEIGNWLRIKIDDKIYKLRLVDYEIDFDNLENINITFSDITVDNSGASSIKDILNQASSMATTYNSVTRQAQRGNESAGVLDDWVDKGLLLTTTKIVDKADNQEVTWDKHGLVCREYDSVTDTYSDKQVKLINKGVYVTDNGWRTAKAGIGNFTFFNPAANNGEGEWQEAYGVIADTLVGNLILGKNVGIYNTANSITMDENGFVLTTDGIGSDDTQPVFTIRRKTVSNGVKSFKDMFYIDSDGFVAINGGIKIDIDGENRNSTIVEMVDGKITTHITDELSNGGLIESSISQTASQIQSTVSAAVSKWDVSELNYNIDLYGYGHPQNDNGLLPVNYDNKHYLDQTNGYVYYAFNGGGWLKVTELALITSNLSSQITQTAGSILSAVSSTYETKADSSNKKTALESSINQTALNIASTVKATSGWDIASLDYTISIIGTVDRGDDHSSIGDYAAEDYIGKFYLNNLTGHVYESKLESDGSGYVWWWKANLTRADSSIYSRIDQTANSIKSTVSATYETKTDATTKKETLESTISQTADQIKLDVSSSLSQYDLSGFSGVISVFGYGVPTASNPSSSTYKNQYYLNQSNGQVYKSSGSSWSTYGNPLSVINGSWQSQITANSNAITSKVGSADVHTIIQQTPEDVRIAWNNISKYISFENAALNIYTSTSQGDSDLLMKLNNSGSWFYKDGTTIGRIGTNIFADDSIKGLVFDLETQAKYMAWTYRDSGASGYNVKFIYFPTNTTVPNGGSSYAKGFHFKDSVYLNSNTLSLNDYVDIRSSDYGGASIYSDSKAISIESRNSELSVWGGITVQAASGYDINFYSDLNMNSHTIENANVTTSSDARFKTNIVDTSINAIELLNQIDLKEFDWIESGEHTSIGIIAQQLQEVMPELVYSNPNDGRLSIKSDRFIPYLIKAIQELAFYLCKDNKNIQKSYGIDLTNIKRIWEDNISITDKKKFIKKSNVKKEEYKPTKPKALIIPE